jgi:hypothetical protein
MTKVVGIRENIMKRIFLLILICTMILCFAGCGNKNNTSSSINPTHTEETGSNATTSGVAATSPTEITTTPTQPVTTQPTTPTIETEPSQGTPDTPPAPQKTLFTFNFGEHQFHFGMPLSEMLAYYPPYSQSCDTGTIVEGEGTIALTIDVGNNQFITVGVYNDSKEPRPMSDCAIWSISVDAADADFFFTPTDQSIDFSMSRADLKGILGSRCIEKDYDTVTYDAWLWTESAGQKLITIGVAFGNSDGQIEYMYIARETLFWNA